MTSASMVSTLAARARANVALAVVAIAIALALFPLLAPLALGGFVVARAVRRDAREEEDVSVKPVAGTGGDVAVRERARVEVEATTTTTTTTTTRRTPVALTGSAAMLAKMRKSSALTGRKTRDRGAGCEHEREGWCG